METGLLVCGVKREKWGVSVPARLLGVGFAVAALLAAALMVLAACSASPGTTYLTEEIPPCTPVDGAGHVDPCNPRGHTVGFSASSLGHSLIMKDSPASIADYLGDDPELNGIVTAHIVVRATYLPDTVRCHATDHGRFAPWSTSRVVPWPITKCYGDVRVNSYIYGSGPPVLTILLGEGLGSAVDEMEEVIVSRDIGGQEEILFLGPAMGYEVEVYQSYDSEPWTVVRENGTVKVVSSDRDYWLRQSESHRTEVEMTLEDFEAKVAEEYAAMLVRYDGRVAFAEEAPAPQPDANKLSDFHRAVGAMDHPEGPPVLPPPPCGKAVPDPANNPGLMRDCETLLGFKDALRGTGTLNWSVDVAMADWDGVRTRGTGRVTDIILVEKGLTGTVPAHHGDLPISVKKEEK